MTHKPKSPKFPAPQSVVMTGYHLKRAREYARMAEEHLLQALECSYIAEADLLALDGVDFFAMEPEKGRRLIGKGIAGAHYPGEAHDYFRKFILKNGVEQPTNEQLLALGGGGGR